MMNSSKRLKLTTVAVAVAAMFPAMYLNAEPTLYGRLDVALTNVDADTAVSDVWELKSYASRFGIKGSEQLNDALSAVYQYEVEIDPEDDSASASNASSSFMKARTQFVGLKGDFGQVRIGRMDTPFKQSQGKVDLFNDHAADLKTYLEGDNRLGNTINYLSPSFGGVAFQVAVMPGENTDVDADGAVDDGIADSISASATYSTDELYLAVAVDQDVDQQDAWRLAGSYKLDMITLGALVQSAEGSGTSPDEQTGYLLSAALKQGANNYKLQYGDSQTDNAAGTSIKEMSSVAVGVDHSFSKLTKLFAELAQLSDDLANKDTLTVAFGIQKNF